MGVNADKWGPGAWRFLHFVTLTFPDNPSSSQRRAYATLFRLLPFVLPCSICRKHLRKAYKTLPPHLKSRAVMIRWLEDIHTAINANLKKTIRRVPVGSALSSFRKGWQPGLRDLVFSIAFNLPRVTLPNNVTSFIIAARRIVGKAHLPSVSHLKSKAGLLNTLSRFYRVSKPRVRAKYRPWLSARSLASSNRVWPASARKSGSANSTKKRSRSSRRQVVQVRIGL